MKHLVSLALLSSVLAVPAFAQSSDEVQVRMVREFTSSPLAFMNSFNCNLDAAAFTAGSGALDDVPKSYYCVDNDDGPSTMYEVHIYATVEILEPETPFCIPPETPRTPFDDGVEPLSFSFIADPFAPDCERN